MRKTTSRVVASVLVMGLSLWVASACGETDQEDRAYACCAGAAGYVHELLGGAGMGDAGASQAGDAVGQGGSAGSVDGAGGSAGEGQSGAGAAGAPVVGCGGGTNLCDGICVGRSSVQHCGDRCDPCPEDPNGLGTPVCFAERCTLDCGSAVLCGNACCEQGTGGVSAQGGSAGQASAGESGQGFGGSLPEGGTAGQSGSGGEPADYTSCSVDGQCVVVPETCCGVCGAATPTDMRAVNYQYREQEQAFRCSQGMACPDCEATEFASLTAVCDEGTCRAVDLTQDPMTECTLDEDCHLHTAECCECGGELEWLVSVSDVGAYSELVCEDGAICPACVPDYDSTGMVARCSQGRCVTAYR